MNPYIIQGIGKGMQNASETLLNVSLKKQELETKKKDTDLTHKIKMLEYEKLEREMDPQLYKDTISLENKKNKLANAATDIALDQLGMMQSKTKSKMESLDTYSKGMSDEAQANQANEGFSLGSQQYDLDLSAAGKGEASFKSRDYSTQLKEEKAKEELRKLKGDKTPLEEQLIPQGKGGFLGFGGKKVNSATTAFAESVKTRQDLINMIKNADALEERGVDITELEDLYEEELVKLAQEGYLNEEEEEEE